jgi:hypothetical protein
VRVFSDLRLFERPPKPGRTLFRWIAWRWLLFSMLFTAFVAVFAYLHYASGEPIYYTNENRNLTADEARSLFALFFAGGGLFFVLGLAGILFIPKAD